MATALEIPAAKRARAVWRCQVSNAASRGNGRASPFILLKEKRFLFFVVLTIISETENKWRILHLCTSTQTAGLTQCVDVGADYLLLSVVV